MNHPMSYITWLHDPQNIAAQYSWYFWNNWYSSQHQLY